MSDSTPLVDATSQGLTATEVPLPERRRALLVDGGPGRMEPLGHALRRASWEVVTAAGDDEALRLAAGGVDLVVLDPLAPETAGFELTRQLKAGPGTAALPVLQVSAAFTQPEAWARGLDSGADACLPFPTEDALLVAQAAALARRRPPPTTSIPDRLREQLYQLIMQAPAAIAVFRGSRHVYELVNPAYERMVNKGGFVGMEIARAFPEAVGQGLFELMDGVFRTGQPMLVSELAVSLARRGSGTGELDEGFYSFNLEPIREPPGGPIVGLMAVCVEITEQVQARRRAESLAEQVRASEQRFRSLVEATAQIIWSMPTSGGFDTPQPGWSAFTGQTFEELRGDGWLAAVHPEDRERTRELWARALRHPMRFESEHRLRRSDGAYRTFHARMVPLLDDGRVREWVGAHEDVTEHRRKEDALRLLAHVGDMLVQTLDSRATLNAVTRLAVPTFADWAIIDMLQEDGSVDRVAVAHADPALAALAEEVRLFVPDGNRVHVPSQGLRATRGVLVEDFDEATMERSARNAEHLRVMQAVDVRSVFAVPLIARHRRLGVLTLIFTSKSRRYTEEDRELAEELGRRAGLAIDNARLFESAERERRRSEEANRAKDEFLAVVSHELRTPLTAILGYASLLRSGNSKPESHARAVEVIERNARAQTQLINDILDVSRIITGKLRLHVQPTDPHAVVQSALEAVHPAVVAKNLRLQTVLDPEAGPIRGDSERLHQVVWNLLTNAIKFTPRSGRISVVLARVSSQVELTVSDNGHGIHPSFLPHVFERFRQADATSTRSHGGLGLGLSIVKHLVELHGGTVRAQSDGEGQGATFTVRLPLAPVLAGESAAPRVQALMSSPSVWTCPPELNGLRVLLVEDEKDSRELVASVLESCQAQVVARASAEEAMEALDQGSFDVLVSDVGMPGEDGYSLIRRVRQRPPEKGGRVPAIALTAYARTEDRLQALLAGFTLHVPKPIDSAELVAVVANLARRDR